MESDSVQINDPNAHHKHECHDAEDVAPELEFTMIKNPKLRLGVDVEPRPGVKRECST